MDDFKNNKTYFDCFGGDKEEFIMLSLRLKSGLNFKEYRERYNEDFPKDKIKNIKKFAVMGYMVLKDDCAYFTPKGYLVSNSIISELI